MTLADRVRRLHDYAWLMTLLVLARGRSDGEVRPDVRTWAARLCRDLADAYDAAGRVSRARYFARQAEFWDPHGPPRPPARAAAMARPLGRTVIDARSRWRNQDPDGDHSSVASAHRTAPSPA